MAELTNIPSRRNRRRNFQFSLRTLLIVLTIFGVWLGFQVRNARQQHEAVNAILDAGGYVLYDYERDANGNYRHDKNGLFIEKPDPPGPDWLRDLIGQDYFVNVIQVSLGEKQLTDEQLVAMAAHLERFPKLRCLFLERQTKITDGGVQGLANLKQIKELYLREDRHLTSTSLSHLRNLTQLRTLEIDGSQLDDEGLSNLVGMKELERLDLDLTHVTDQGLSHLSSLPNLKVLGLYGDSITDAGVAKLAQLNGFVQLGLGHTHITDSAVPTLRTFTKLKEVSVETTAVTPEGVRALQAALPNTKIITTNGILHPPGTSPPPSPPSPFGS